MKIFDDNYRNIRDIFNLTLDEYKAYKKIFVRAWLRFVTNKEVWGLKKLDKFVECDRSVTCNNKTIIGVVGCKPVWNGYRFFVQPTCPECLINGLQDEFDKILANLYEYCGLGSPICLVKHYVKSAIRFLDENKWRFKFEDWYNWEYLKDIYNSLKDVLNQIEGLEALMMFEWFEEVDSDDH